jgi:hypothetical protein
MVSIIEINGISLKQPIMATYKKAVNEKSTADIRLDATTQFDRDNFAIGNIVTFTDSGVTEIKGKIKNVARLEGGGLKIAVVGMEHYEYSNTPVSDVLSSLGTNGVWVGESSVDIFTELLNAAPNWTAGTIDTGITGHDFRVSRDESLWNGIKKLLDDTGQYINIDYDNSRIDILNSIGSSDVFSFKEGQNISQPRFVIDESQGLKVLVFGKGDGQYQVLGEATDASYAQGDPIYKITDPNIISENQANQRASIELSKIKNQKKNYDFNVVTPDINICLGDSGNINSPSASLDNETITVVQIKKGVRSNKPILSVEVTNSEYLQRLQKRDDKLIELERELRSFKSGSQGSGNTQIYEGQIAGDSSLPLIIPININSSDYEDDGGNIRVLSFKLDYDIDPFRQTAGDISPSGIDADVSGISADENPDCENNTALTSIDTNHNYNFVNSAQGYKNTVDVQAPYVSGDTDFSIITFYLLVEKTTVNRGFEIFIENLDTNSAYYEESGFCKSSVDSSGSGSSMFTASIIVNGDIEGDDIRMQVKDVDEDDERYGFGISVASAEEHQHSAGTLNAENHPHSSGSYECRDNDVADAIVIGDTVSDSASVNATGITWELRYWNGSVWTLKNSGTETFGTETFETDIDISDSGTYPDVAGKWRMYIYTNSTDADTIKGRVKLKHNLNN